MVCRWWSGIQNHFVLSVDSVLGHVETPASYEAAIEGRLGAKWKESMEKEIRDLLANKTWEYVSKIPPGGGWSQTLSGRFIYLFI